MLTKIGTFNLNNLFSRWNFEAEISEIPEGDRDVRVFLEFDDDGSYRFRQFAGQLIKPMPEEQRQELADRILRMDLDVLAVQEVEDLEALRDFSNLYLKDMYPNAALIEGNDPRFIDVGVLSKRAYPLGAVTSWQHEVHPATSQQRVFARDLLEVEVLDAGRTRRLFTLFVNHLTSQYVEYGTDPVIGKRQKDARRKQQAEKIREIIERRLRPDSWFIVLGDMNDTPNAVTLAPFARSATLRLTNALKDPQETRPAKLDVPPPKSKAWTHRYKEANLPARYDLFDQIWLSPSLAPRQQEAWIERRSKHAGDGSDHDPAWVVLDI